MDDQNQTPVSQSPPVPDQNVPAPEPPPPTPLPIPEPLKPQSTIIEPLPPSIQEEETQVTVRTPDNPRPLATPIERPIPPPALPRPIQEIAALPAATNNTIEPAIEQGNQKPKKRMWLVVLIVCVVIILLGGAGGFYYWYSSNDHSIYSKLVTSNYNQNGIIFSYQYPSIMQPDAALLSKVKSTSNYGTLSLYAYTVPGVGQAVINASFENIAPALQELKLTPQEFTSQIKSGSGSYVTALDKLDPNGYSGLYGSCGSTIANVKGQTSLICTPTGKTGFVVTGVVGITGQYQYYLELIIPSQIWQAHQKVWQKIEKSFIYQ